MHILDIAENSAAAGAKTVRIRISENTSRDQFRLVVEDDGRGMTKEEQRQAQDPFYTTKKTRRFGFGLSLLAETARAAGGNMSLHSRPGKGTITEASFRISHIDAKPLGDMAETLAALILGNPGIDFIYTHKLDGRKYSLDTRKIKRRLNEVPINTPEVIRFIKNYINEGIDQIRRQK